MLGSMARVVRQYELSKDAADRLDLCSATHGIGKKELMSRLVERFSGLDFACQQLLIGTLAPEFTKQASQMMVDRLSAQVQMTHASDPLRHGPVVDKILDDLDDETDAPSPPVDTAETPR